MEDEDREKKLAILPRTATRLPFFALVNHLSRLFPEAPRVGGLGPIEREVIRFRHDVRPVFHPGDVAELRIVRKEDRLRVEITTTFLGVIGSVSPLASYFTEDVLRAESRDDQTLVDFYDVFHHRLIAFIYRAQLRGAPWSEVRSDGLDPTSARAIYLTSRFPRGARSPLQARQELALTRVFARRPRSRDGLQAALALAFPGVPIAVLDFVSRSIPLDRDERAMLGVQHVTLGHGARLGRHLPQQTGLVRLVVGPVDRPTFESFLPGGENYPRMRGIVEARTGGMLDCDAEIEIRCGDEPRARLGGQSGTRLGRTSLVGRPRSQRPMRVRVSLTAGGERQRPVFLGAPS